MDRQIVYIGAIPQDTDLLQQNKNAMIGLGYALQAILGSSTVVDGLACTPNSPAAMNVLVAPGSIYSLEEVDATAYGSLAADTTDQIVKQGILTSAQTFSTPAPATTGQSVVYLIEAAYQDVDGGSTVLPYYNAANPAVAWSGPNNTGTSQNTVRKGVCTVQIKTGTPATTGTQTTPAPDAGFTGLYAVTVANGQTTVTSGNIQQLATAPFIATKIPAIQAAIQASSPNYAQDTSGAANTITVALSPVPSALTNGMPIRVKIANSSTGPTVMNTNGMGNVSCTTTSGAAFSTNTVVANGIYTFVYDANGTRWQIQASSERTRLSGAQTFYVNASSGSDANTGLSSGAAWQTISHALLAIATNYDLNNQNVTIQLADGTYATGLQSLPWVGGGSSNVTINGDSVTPANVIVQGLTANNPGCGFTVTNMQLTNPSGAGLNAGLDAQIYTGSGVIFGACSTDHVNAQNSGNIVLNNAYTISGSSQAHFNAGISATITLADVTVTLTGTPAFSAAFALSNTCGGIFINSGATFTGSATGSRYSATVNGWIDTQGAGATYFPGSTSGSTATGGQYA